MKVLIVLGSPRKNGNSETLARIVADKMSQNLPMGIEYVRLTKQSISPCIGCGSCEKTGMCVIQDDMIDLYKRVDLADIIFIVSPIYFYGPSAQIKTFIDRFQARWSRKYLLKEHIRHNERRAGYLISIGATKGEKLFDASILIAKSFFDAIDVPYCDSFVIRGVDEIGAINEETEEMREASLFALNISKTMKVD